jgi:glycosyltransferase involved in cell wall biosynthesis
LRIVYYTHTAFFEPALSLVRELSRHAEVHLLLEITPHSWGVGAFDAAPRDLPEGLVPGDEVLAGAFPETVREYWKCAASFHLVVHRAPRSLSAASWRVSRRVLAFARELGADVLHVDDVDVTPRLALALPGARRPPVVLSTHDPEPHSGETGWRKTLGRRLAYPRVSRFILHNRRLEPSFRARNRLAADRVSTVRLGAYTILRAWRAEAEERPRSVLFFGRLSPYKGLDVLYEAAESVAARVPGFRLVVAGRAIDGYTPPPAPPGVELIDRYIPTSELPRLFGEASIVVCPYRDATQSGVVLSAYAFAKPVVASDVGGLADYVEEMETGLLVPPADADALAEALVRLLLDDGLRERMSLRIEAASELSWTRAARETLAVYERACGT